MSANPSIRTVKSYCELCKEDLMFLAMNDPASHVRQLMVFQLPQNWIFDRWREKKAVKNGTEERSPRKMKKN